MAFDYERFNRRYGPWISLGLGVTTVVFVHRGATYAPVAAAFLIVGWVLALALRRWLDASKKAGDQAQPGRIRRLLPAAAATASVGLYQNVLFYLVPIWAASATWPTVNVVFPVLLAAMALFSCFEYPYRAYVLDRPPVLGVFSAVTLFAALVPAFTVLLDVPLRMALAGAAVVAGLASAAGVVPARRLGWRKGLPVFLGALGLSLGILVSSGPYLPPVPVVCVGHDAGTAIAQRELVGRAGSFPTGTRRVYAWFSVAAPARWRQPVQFHWFHDGVSSGNPIDHEVTGGRETGFRTWTWRNAPAAGNWRVDLVTDSDQLVGRVRFRVEEP
jgi:hypothetical protein